MWGLFLLASPADAGHPLLDPRVNEARILLSSGATSAARAVLSPMVEEHPKSGSLVHMLAATWLVEGECERGLELLSPWRDSNAWTARTSQTVASCYDRRGETGEALYWMDESFLLSRRETPELFANLAYYRWSAGDYEGARDALAEADALEVDASATRLLRAQIAVEEGFHRQAAFWLDSFVRDPDASRFATALRGQLELDVGSDRAARQLLVLNVRAAWSPPTAALLAEGWRRGGNPEAALDTLHGPRARAYMQPIRVIEVRVLADLGRLEEAEPLLAEARRFNALDPEVLASAWYLAKTRGDEAEAARLARLYAHLQPNPHRALAALIPTESP